MPDIVQYFMNNYIWILSIIIVILLAVIGYFADKTNFGQGTKDDPEKNETKDNTKDLDLSDKPIDKVEDSLTQPIQPEFTNSESDIHEQKDDNKEQDSTVELTETDGNEHVNDLSTTTEKDKENFSQPLDSFITPVEKIKQSSTPEPPKNDIDVDQVFNEAIPVKSLIDDDLISDIDNLTLDNKKDEEVEIPDLDDIELPKIQSLSDDKEEDIWRF